MSDRVKQLMADLTEYLAATEGDKAQDEVALVDATEKIAQVLGDTGMKPGDFIRLRNGATYSAEPAFFNDGVEGNANTGQLLCRNWMSLESTREVISDAEAHQILGDGIHVPLTWDEDVRPNASIEDRRAFLKELPELASRLREMAVKRRDPELGKSARLAQKLAEVITAETEAPSL